MELDHIFVLCSVGAPEADALINLGLKEGSSNRHPDQGTANRRFFFQSAYLELLWVDNPEEAQSEAVRPTRLWDRWVGRSRSACPFGVVLRPVDGTASSEPPFPTWSYRPSYLPPDFSIEIARDTPVTEPEFFYLGFRRGQARVGQEPTTHAIPAADITDMTIGLPGGSAQSSAATLAVERGVLSFERSEDYVLRLTFDRARCGQMADLRPRLPMVVRW